MFGIHWRTRSRSGLNASCQTQQCGVGSHVIPGIGVTPLLNIWRLIMILSPVWCSVDLNLFKDLSIVAYRHKSGVLGDLKPFSSPSRLFFPIRCYGLISSRTPPILPSNRWSFVCIFFRSAAAHIRSLDANHLTITPQYACCFELRDIVLLLIRGLSGWTLRGHWSRWCVIQRAWLSWTTMTYCWVLHFAKCSDNRPIPSLTETAQADISSDDASVECLSGIQEGGMLSHSSGSNLF